MRVQPYASKSKTSFRVRCGSDKLNTDTEIKKGYRNTIS